MKLLLILGFGFFYLGCFSQNIDGQIVSKLNGEGLYGINIIASSANEFVKGTSSDVNGNFSLELDSGSYEIEVNGLGYKTLLLNVNLDEENISLGIIYLEEEALESTQAIISAKALKVPNATLISKDFFDRIPGAFSDPSRLTIKFPGISPTNDQSNEIIVRGLAPHLSRWAINGASIVNPNHLSNAGTITDLASASGGGVNMISGNSIGSYSFYSNPMNEEYFNVTGGVSDTKLKIPVGLQASIGLLGTEVSFQNNKKVQFGINYRYSTLGILSAIGVPLGDEKINFQDIHLSLGKKIKKHSFNYDFLFGVNSNIHESLGENSVFFKDALQVDFNANQMLSSFQHNYKSYKKVIKNVFNASYRYANREVNSDEVVIPELPLSSTFNFSESLFSFLHSSKYSLTPNINLKWNAQMDYNYFVNSDMGDLQEYRCYLSSGIKWNKNQFTINFDPGLSVIHENINFEFRGSIMRRLGKGKLKMAYSHMANSIIAELGFYNLKPFNSDNFSLDYYINTDKMYFQVGIFYNQYFDLPISVSSQVSYFDRIDLIQEDLNMNDFVNDGDAIQYGVQAQFEYLLFNKLQFISTASFYDIIVEHEGREINSSFNFNYTYANTFSYTKSANKGRFVSSLAFQGHGAGYEANIDEELSLENLSTIHHLEENKEVKLNPYFRIDLKLDYLWGEEDRNRIGLDIQNVSNRKNDAYFYFDPLLEQIQKQNQLGIIPIIKYTRKIL